MKHNYTAHMIMAVLSSNRTITIHRVTYLVFGYLSRVTNELSKTILLPLKQ